jgi:hypothetical protein
MKLKEYKSHSYTQNKGKSATIGGFEDEGEAEPYLCRMVDQIDHSD